MHIPNHCLSSPHVLIVDDDRDTADSLALLLSLWGHQPLVAYDGFAALEMAANQCPDAIVLDIGLPKLDGYALAHRLRRLPGMARAPVIAVTGYGQETDRQRSRAAGIDHHLLKPIDPRELRRLLPRAG